MYVHAWLWREINSYSIPTTLRDLRQSEKDFLQSCHGDTVALNAQEGSSFGPPEAWLLQLSEQLWK